MNVMFINAKLFFYSTLLLCMIHTHISYAKTFSISLQSNDKLSLDTWASYKGNVPELKEFTELNEFTVLNEFTELKEFAEFNEFTRA